MPTGTVEVVVKDPTTLPNEEKREADGVPRSWITTCWHLRAPRRGLGRGVHGPRATQPTRPRTRSVTIWSWTSWNQTWTSSWHFKSRRQIARPLRISESRSCADQFRRHFGTACALVDKELMKDLTGEFQFPFGRLAGVEHLECFSRSCHSERCVSSSRLAPSTTRRAKGSFEDHMTLRRTCSCGQRCGLLKCQ